VKRRVVAFLLLVAGSAHAQPPGTDIYLLPVRDGLLARLTPPLNATARVGYDNQPGFLADSSGFRFTRIDSSGQADIWVHDLESGRSRNLTRSLASEYSATPIPGEERFSVVQVEADSTQRLWSFAPDGSDPRLVLEEPSGVGYHAWGGDGELVLFLLGTPHELHRARAGTDGSRLVAKDIGRCLQAIPGEDAWSFPLADADAGWILTRLDRSTGALSSIAPAPSPGVQDYCWTPQGELWSSDGTALLVWREGEWETLRNLEGDGIRGITRMAVSPDGSWLAFVADDPEGNR
jgi:hypothetical protein